MDATKPMSSLVEQRSHLDLIGCANTGVVREDILKPAREGVLLQEEHHYSCNREEEAAEEPRIRNNDNSNHSTAVCSDSGVWGYTHVEDEGAAEEGGARVVVQGEQARDHSQDDDRVEELGTMNR